MSDPAATERARRVPADPPPAPARAPAPGARIGSLELVARLGSGGMGEVWEARDLELDRLVAIKLMAPEPAASNAAQRFRREARAAASINHPNVAQVFFAGVHEDRLYYVMEHVAGSSLERTLRERGRLPPARALELLRQAAEGLRAAQRAGVIHRDLKPANLMVDPAGVLKIVDFGLARRELDTTLTRANAVLGTPTYMAPEQAKGREVDHRADIYALGATFYHLLCGKPPFGAPAALLLAERHVSAPLPPLARRAPDVPRPLCALVERMMAKEPAARFQSYDELLVEISSVREAVGEGWTAAGEADEEGEDEARPRRGWVAAALVAVALAAAWFAVDRLAPAGRGAAAPAAASSIPARGGAPPATGAAAGEGSGQEDVAAALEAAVPDDPADPAATEGFDDPFPLGALATEEERAAGAARDFTAERMRSLAAAIAAFLRERGRAPRSLAELSEAFALPAEELRDAWDEPLHLERPRGTGAAPYVVSAGPDRRLRTGDDLFFVAGRLRSAH